MGGLILERDDELSVIAAAVKRAEAGSGSLLLVEGTAGIGKTALLAAAPGERDSRGQRVPVHRLAARGLALEAGFSFGVVRQLLEPVRAACQPGEWDELVAGAAGAAREVFDGGADGGADPYATAHALYRLTANLAARRPLLIAVDDLHWADTDSLRWLSHLAARIEGLPAALLLAVRTGPGQPDSIAGLRALPHCERLAPRPLTSAAVRELVRRRLGAHRAGGEGAGADGAGGDHVGGDDDDDELAAACREHTGGIPFLLESLLDWAADPSRRAGAGGGLTVRAVRAAGPERVAEAALRLAASAGPDAGPLIRAVAVLGGPAQLRQAAELAGLDIAGAALLADRLRTAGVLAPGDEPEFAQPIVAAAVYQSVPPGERALAHARAARILRSDCAGPEHVARHLMRGLPAGDPLVVEGLLAAARAATGRGAPGAAAAYLRRALTEPPDPAAAARVSLQLGLTLASVRDPDAVGVLRDGVRQATERAVALATPDSAADAALVSAGVLSLWGHHDSAREVCHETIAALREAGMLDPAREERLTTGLLAESWLKSATAADAWQSWSRSRPGRRAGNGTGPGAGGDAGAAAWRVLDALSATITGEGRAEALARLGPLPAASLVLAESYPPAVSLALLVLNWNDEYAAALGICDRLLAAARERGWLNIVADVRCQRSGILRRLGRLREAAADARYGFDYERDRQSPGSVDTSR
jgi:hypothetical protein